METFDLIVVGAGIVGLSTAWRARKAGARVLVLDKGATAYEASSRATGLLSLCGASRGLLPDGAKSYAKLFSATCTPL